VVDTEPSHQEPDKPRQWTTFRVVTAVLIPLLAIAVPVLISQRDNADTPASAAMGSTPPRTPVAATSAPRTDGCMLGLWNRVSPRPDTIGWQDRSVPATPNPDSIESWFFGADRTGTIRFALELTATADDGPVDQTIDGTAQFTYRVESGTVLFTDGPVAGHVITRIGGQRVDDTTLTVRYAPAHITCQPHKTLTLAFGGDGGTLGFVAPR
jgi:hypothetical protein